MKLLTVLAMVPPVPAKPFDWDARRQTGGLAITSETRMAAERPLWLHVKALQWKDC